MDDDRPPDRLSDPARRLSRRDFSYLRAPSDRRERYALVGMPPPVRQRQLPNFPRGRDPHAWHPLPDGVLLTFTGDVVPVLIEPGELCYRVVGEGSYPNGSFWTPDRPRDEDSMRRDYALLNSWNGDHGLIALRIVRPIAAWRGMAGPQRSSDRRGHLPGGAVQLWVPAGALGPSHGDWTIERL